MGLTPAEKQRAYRERKAAAAAIAVTLPRAEYDMLTAALADLHQAVSGAAARGNELARTCLKDTPTATAAALSSWLTTAPGPVAVTVPEQPPAPAVVTVMAAMLVPNPSKGGLWAYLWASEYTVAGVHTLDEYLHDLQTRGYQATPAPELQEKCERRHGDPARDPRGIPIRTRRKDGKDGEGLVIVWLPKKPRRR